MQEEYHAKRKMLYMCFVDLKKAFDRVLRKVLEWALRTKALVKSAMKSLYNRAKTKIRKDSELSDEFEGKVGMHQGPAQLWLMLSLN